MYRIPEEDVIFPDPTEAEDGGAARRVGGDLRPERLLLAYANGIFPWYNEGQPILWFSPDPAMCTGARNPTCGRSLRKTLRKAARFG